MASNLFRPFTDSNLQKRRARTTKTIVGKAIWEGKWKRRQAGNGTVSGTFFLRGQHGRIMIRRYSHGPHSLRSFSC